MRPKVLIKKELAKKDKYSKQDYSIGDLKVKNRHRASFNSFIDIAEESDFEEYEFNMIKVAVNQEYDREAQEIFLQSKSNTINIEDLKK